MTAALNTDIQPLQSALEAKGVRYAFASYVDLHGVSKGKMVPIEHLDRMLGGSELFTGAALDGVPQAVSDDEVAAVPDPQSATVLPWKNEVAWFASDLHLHGAPFEACSRNILKRQLANAAGMGYRFNLGLETEFFILKDDEHGNPVPAAARDTLAKPAYDLRLLLDNFGPVTELVEAMNTLGWDVYSFDHEDANGQFETDFMYSDALTMADRFVFFRFMANEIARKHGYYASFMPKPFVDRTGSGAHYNMSLADLRTGANLFETDNDARGCGISKLAYHFIAGVLRHGAAISAVIAPTVNSYKRLGAGVHLLRQQQPHQHDPRADGRRAHRMPRRRHRLQSLSGRGPGAGRRSRRHPRATRPGRAAPREHVPLQRG